MKNDKLKKEQIMTRIIGFIMFSIGIVIYPVSFALSFVYLIPIGSILLVAGAVLALRSFVHVKFSELRKYRSQSSSDGNVLDNLKQKISQEIMPDTTDEHSQSSEFEKYILGCLVGGAAGDALGYSVEFLRYGDIIKKYGQHGITEYDIDPKTQKALISDDTQMTLFTAEGILRQEGIELDNIYASYLNWLETQTVDFDKRLPHPESALMQRIELYERRAPGNTCLSALSSGIMGTVPNPINSSKGCGGVMRVSTIAFLRMYDTLTLDKMAAQASAITHGHPLGYLSSALLVHILHKLIYKDKKSSLQNIINTCIEEFESVFSSAPFLSELLDLMRKAISLSKTQRPDLENIAALGEGWVAEETLAIAVYCVLRYPNDFSSAIRASVNHDGDSDSTGAVTGNILGARLGIDKIDSEWKEKLELYDVIVDFAKRFGE